MCFGQLIKIHIYNDSLFWTKYFLKDNYNVCKKRDNKYIEVKWNDFIDTAWNF